MSASKVTTPAWVSLQILDGAAFAKARKERTPLPARSFELLGFDRPPAPREPRAEPRPSARTLRRRAAGKLPTGPVRP